MKKSVSKTGKKEPAISKDILKKIAVEIKPWGKKWLIRIDITGYYQGNAKCKKTYSYKLAEKELDWSLVTEMVEKCYNSFYEPAF